MAGFGGVDEEGRRAGRGQGRRDLAAMWPDLPSPVTMTRPLALRIRSTALANGLAQRAAQGGGERVDAAALGLQRAERGFDAVGVGPDDWVISGFELGMFWSREEGRRPWPA